MSGRMPSPEEVIASFSIPELQELLADLKMDASPLDACRLQQLVRELRSFESAVETIGGVATMKRAA